MQRPTRPVSPTPGQASAHHLPGAATLRQIKGLEIRALQHVEAIAPGEYRSAFKGRGIEFADLREYQPGDDVRTIDWFVTARAGIPFVKQFIEERELTVMIAVDVGPTMRFGSDLPTKRGLAVEAAAALAQIALDNHDRVGLRTFGGHPDQSAHRIEQHSSIPARKGRPHHLAMLRALVPHLAHDSPHAPQAPASLTAQSTHPLRALATALGRTHTRRSVLFIISDFHCDAGTEQRTITASLGPLALRHEVLALRVVDPRERTLPRAGLMRIADPTTGAHMLIDTTSRAVRQRFAELAAQREQRVDDAIRAAGCTPHVLPTSLAVGRGIARALAQHGQRAPSRAGSMPAGVRSTRAASLAGVGR